MGDWAELRQSIETFLAADSSREVTEEGELLFALDRTEYRLEETHGKLLLHLWSDERNWVRRVVGVAEQEPDRLVLEVERFGQRRPGRMTIAHPSRRAGLSAGRKLARRAYTRYLRKLLQREFPRAKIEGLSTAADMQRSFSGIYTRARLQDGRRWWVVMGVNDGEDAAAVDGLLTYALIWLDWNRHRSRDRVWAGVRLFLPARGVATTAHRVAYLDPERIHVELFSVNADDGSCTLMDIADRGNLETRLEFAGHRSRLLKRESSAVGRVQALAPDEIEPVALAGRDELVLRFRGLDFARSAGGRVTFGVGGEESVLAPDNFDRLAGLVSRLQQERTPEGTPANSLYRWRAEGWLESMVVRQPGRMDARLHPDHLYRQVLLAGGSERGVADLLGVTREGRLVIMELKAACDIHLPLQGLDYWLRVHWHHRRGKLADAGYFRGLRLQSEPPELLLVAPALQFHPTTQAVVGYFSSQIRVTLVGLREDWRRELKVVWRQGFPEQEGAPEGWGGS